MQLTARKRRVASPWGRQAPGSACDRLLPPPGRVAEPQRRAVLTLPQPRDRRGERFYEHARHPARERRPVNHLYGLVCGEGSAAVCYGEPLRGAAPGSEPKSGTTPPSPRSRRYGSPMRVDHSVNHDAPGLRRTERVLRYRTPEPRLWGRFSPDLDGHEMIQASRPSGFLPLPYFSWRARLLALPSISQPNARKAPRFAWRGALLPCGSRGLRL